MRNADLTDSCNIPVMQLMYHSEFDIFKMASRLVEDTFYKFVLKNVIPWKQRMHQRTETRMCKFSGSD